MIPLALTLDCDGTGALFVWIKVTPVAHSTNFSATVSTFQLTVTLVLTFLNLAITTFGNVFMMLLTPTLHSDGDGALFVCIIFTILTHSADS